MRPLGFVLAATDHGTMIVNRNDYHQLPNGATYGVGHQLLTYGCYDPGEISDILQTLKDRRTTVGPNMVVLDCGANIGVHSIEIGRFLHGWGTVIAFEAQERLFYALCGNIALANLYNVNAVLAAVGPGCVDKVSVPSPDYNKPASFGSLELRHTPSTEYIGQRINYNRMQNTVRAISIDSLNLHRVDFIKLDVEGMELDVIEGASRTITNCRPHMLIEWIKTDRVKLEEILTSFGYSFAEFGGNLKAAPLT